MTRIHQPSIPEPDLTGAPLYIDAGDRRVAVLAALKVPRVIVFGDFLSTEECDELMQTAQPRLDRSRVLAPQNEGDEINDYRTSDGMFFQRGETDLITRIEARIAALLRWPVENGEGLQILRYQPGGEYQPHWDYFEPDQSGTATILARGGQRVGTFIMYLHEPEQGGSTDMVDINFSVAAKRGNALFFSYAAPDTDTLTMHAGAPVVAGEKWIATKWLRERVFV